MPAFSMTEIMLVDIILNMNTGLPPLPPPSPKVSVGMNLENETQDWDPKKQNAGLGPCSLPSGWLASGLVRCPALPSFAQSELFLFARLSPS